MSVDSKDGFNCKLVIVERKLKIRLLIVNCNADMTMNANVVFFK